MKKIFVLAAMIAVSMVGSAQASIVVSWNFNDGRTTGGAGNFGPSPLAPGDAIANVTTVGLTRNHDLGATGSGAANAFGANNFNITSPDFDSAITNNNFFTFSVTPDANYLLSFTSIDAYNIRRSGTGPGTGRWQYQVGTGGFVDLTSDITWGATTTVAGNSQNLIDLSSVTALQDLTETLTFRVVTWGATSTGGTWYFNTTGAANNDLVVRGSVSAIPEPTSVALLGLGLIGLVSRRRRN